ncbi:Isochorismatase domain-containing protein 2 [Trichoplax sp. H2]|nr:Isochorismatase domain-containing protein 2 [Trichoplax sp. H2]|eukprot:RDD47186.1 Isochorismatase domain-containing protein 2 [Trichoplax sp. H2]
MKSNEGLGNTITELNITECLQHDHSLPIVQKTKFSMVVPEVYEKISTTNRKSIVLFGIEAHVCVLQTALDLRQKGYNVYVIADAISSRSRVDRLFAIERMRQSGIFITTYESMLLGLVGDSKNAKFKDIQKLILELPPDSKLL